MGRNRVKRLVVFAWTFLLLGLVQGWEFINEQQRQSILEGRPLVPDHEEEDEDDLFEGEATNEDLNPDFELRGPRVQAVPTPDLDKDHTGFKYECTQDAFVISISKKELDKVQVLGQLNPEDSSESCGYHVHHEQGILTVPFSRCFVKYEKSGYSLQLWFAEESQVRTAYCKGDKPDNTGWAPRSGGVPQTRNCPFSSLETPNVGPLMNPPQQQQQQQMVQQSLLPLPPAGAQNCAVSPAEQVACGYPGISLSACISAGCCVDSSTLSCFYPLDECTEDHHFVFAIRRDALSLPVDPRSLLIPGTNCRPVIVSNSVAIFKFKLDECGARTFNVGGTKIYLAEVHTAVEFLNLKYGVISRSSQVRFIVECRYSLSAQQSLVSTGYMVKTSSSILPSSVKSEGLFGVELKIALDGTYSSFYPTYHPPLRLLLGNPVYLQLSLLSPNADAVILVNYCIAYPLSARNALVLVYEGCANPHDPHTSVLLNSEFTQKKNERHFVVKAFQFMDQSTNLYLDEEIYFMCSTEVCFPSERTCQERCFDGKPSHLG